MHNLFLPMSTLFQIWSQCQFPIRLAHVQYITRVIKDDSKFLRKKYGVQFLLDTVRRFYTGIELLNNEDSRAVRHELLLLVKYYILKDANVAQITAILRFILTVKEETLVSANLFTTLKFVRSSILKIVST